MQLTSRLFARPLPTLVIGGLVCSLLAGCAAGPGVLPGSGPSRAQIMDKPVPAASDIPVIDLTDAVARELLASQRQTQFSDVFSATARSAYLIGAGDVLEVSVWEAPPAALFVSGAVDARNGNGTSRTATLPEQMVSAEGGISVPFAGKIQAAGRSPGEIEADIVRRLKGKANQPQALVRVIRNNTANVTVVGEVASSTRMPLTGRGERLLDALAAAGGVRQPVSKMTLQVTRGDTVQAMPLDAIIRDPRQNIVLQPGDVVTSLFQPLSFSVLGAVGKNEEINFEAQGISLAQALARAGGLQDGRADARGVFVFRFQPRNAMKATAGNAGMMRATPDDRVPVIYRVDLQDPAAFFTAQGFAIQNKDVLYVSNAPAVDLQKFLGIVGSVVYPAISVQNATH